VQAGKWPFDGFGVRQGLAMTRTTLAALTLVLVLTACATVRESRLNPFNWFGRAERVQTAPLPDETGDPRALVAQVLTLEVEPYPGGAIVRATGLPPDQGWWEAELVPREIDEDGVLVYDFRVQPPLRPTGVVNQQSREIGVAASLSNIRLERITRITVQGAANALTTAR